jgi:hypothetical protein
MKVDVNGSKILVKWFYGPADGEIDEMVVEKAKEYPYLDLEECEDLSAVIDCLMDADEFDPREWKFLNRTVCVIYEAGELTEDGVFARTYCNIEEDYYDKEEGRKRSLTRAVQEATEQKKYGFEDKEFRRVFWVEALKQIHGAWDSQDEKSPFYEKRFEKI